MKRSEIAAELAGGICFLTFLYITFMALYVFAPYQPSMHSEAAHLSTQP